MVKTKAQRTREGLMLCMLLTSCIEGRSRAEELREIVLVVTEEPEFLGPPAADLDSLLEAVQKDLHQDPEQIIDLIGNLLQSDNERRRGVELATRIVVADGIVRPGHVELLEKLCSALEVAPEHLSHCVIKSQKRLVRFMMVYLMHLTASSDGHADPVEFEEMIAFALNQPVFQGITTEQYRFINDSVRRHVDYLEKQDWGLDYICGTLVKAAELLDEPDIPRQALKLVARGMLADGVIEDGERAFFHQVAERLSLSRPAGEEAMEETIRESQTQVRKL